MHYRLKIEKGETSTYYYPEVKRNYFKWDSLVPHLQDSGHVYVSRSTAKGYADKSIALAIIENHKKQMLIKDPNVLYEPVQ